MENRKEKLRKEINEVLAKEYQDYVCVRYANEIGEENEILSTREIDRQKLIDIFNENIKSGSAFFLSNFASTNDFLDEILYIQEIDNTNLHIHKIIEDFIDLLNNWIDYSYHENQCVEKKK